MHGGGFVALSTSSHQIYLRKYAKETDSILFSIDYPKAPAFKYSQILLCIIKFYLFVYCYLVNVIQVEPQIILTGDSAGGNLVTALCQWIIINKMSVPKALVVCYPVMNMNIKSFTPSYLYSFNDYLLNFGMLLLVLQCIMDHEDNAQVNFMLSPVYCPNEVLVHFPKTYISVCQKDPLHDGGVIFA